MQQQTQAGIKQKKNPQKLVVIVAYSGILVVIVNGHLLRVVGSRVGNVLSLVVGASIL